jgi:MFS transporter, FSR family, fosmidomycin resistance protein
MIINKIDRHAIVITLLGVAHGIADAAAGLLIIRLAMSSLAGVAATIFTYQFLAFGTQPIVGLIIDRYRSARAGVVVALLATSIGLLLRSVSPILTILLAGLGAAAFHVSAGSIVATESGRSIVPFGWFAAPGVVGLALGGTLALNTPTDSSIIFALVTIAIVLNWLLPPQSILNSKNPSPELSVDRLTVSFAGREGIGLLLLTAISVRSLVWNLVDGIHQGDRLMLIYLALAAGVGKIAGGFLADRFGWRQWGTIALFCAAVCLNFSDGQLGFLLIGVSLLQSVTPIALATTIALCPGLPATGSGLALGLAIALGGILFLMFPALVPTSYLGAIALCAVVLLFYSIGDRQHPRS